MQFIYKILKSIKKCKKNLKQKWNIKIYYLNDLKYFLYIFHAKNKAETKITKKSHKNTIKDDFYVSLFLKISQNIFLKFSTKNTNDREKYFLSIWIFSWFLKWFSLKKNV